MTTTVTVTVTVTVCPSLRLSCTRPGSFPTGAAGEDEGDHRHRGRPLRPRRASSLRGRRLRGSGRIAAAGHER